MYQSFDHQEQDQNQFFSRRNKRKFCVGTALFLILLLIVLLIAKHHVDEHHYINENNYKIETLRETNSFVDGTLLINNDYDYYNDYKSSKYIKNLTFNFTFDSIDELTLRIQDADNERFELPHQDPFPYSKVHLDANATKLYDVVISPNKNNFYFKIVRKSTQQTVFDNYKMDFVFSERYIEFSTKLSSKNIYGFGERRLSNFRYKPGNYTMYPKANFAQFSDGSSGQQTYGFHPVYLQREHKLNWNMVFFRNYFDQEVQIDEQYNLKYKTIGGIIELKFFFGDQDPENVIKKYHAYINGYFLPPFWAMGYHQSRWGYNSSAKLLQVVQKFNETSLPLDAIWNDLDYLQDKSDFTLNDNWNKSDLLTIQNQFNVSWIPILDIGIHQKQGDNPYDEGCVLNVILGKAKNVFIKSAITGDDLVNCVWCNETVYPDFNHPNTSSFWDSQLNKMYDRTPYQGIWLDMNEPEAFVEGEIVNGQKCPPIPGISPINETSSQKNIQISTSEFENFDFLPICTQKPIESVFFPYLPGNSSISNKTISWNATHFDDGVFVKGKNLTELELHSISSIMEANVTFKTLQTRSPLPFILTRANAAGSQKFAAHWTGDNYAAWSFLQASIINIINNNIAGQTMVGADICGFAGNTTEQLCTRWMQLGSFYPFSRNHNSINAYSQEPYHYGLNSTVYLASKASLTLRYKLLKHYYKLFLQNNGTGTIFRPLLFEFPSDDNLLDEGQQFLIGKDLMVAPALYENQTTVQVYFPLNTTWFSLYSERNSTGYQNQNNTRQNFTCQLNGTANVFARSGSVIPQQGEMKSNGLITTKDLGPLTDLYIFLTSRNESNQTMFSASGSMIGIQNLTNQTNVVKQCVQNNCLLDIQVNAFKNENNTLNVTLKIFGQYNGSDQNILNRAIIRGYGQADANGTYDFNKINITNNLTVNFNLL